MNNRKSFLNYVCLFLLFGLAGVGCGGPVETPTPIPTETASPWAPIASGDHTGTLTVGGMQREYILHIPPGYDHARPAALVLAYHGFSLDANEMMRISSLSALADQENFLVAYPQGTGEYQSWNGGNCCGEAMEGKVDDVAFTRLVIEDIARQVNLDRARVYATGFSNGAMMVYRLACELADQIAAIAPVSAAPQVLSCNPSQPVSVIHFHGDADIFYPYEGGAGVLIDNPDRMSVEEGLALWVGFDGCPSQAQESQEGNIVHRTYAPCQGGTAVELYKILGGVHAWPGGFAVAPAEFGYGDPTMEIDASALMWEFFEEHPMP